MKQLALVSGLALALTLGATNRADAASILLSATFSGSDCHGVFGNPSGGGGQPVCDVGTALITGDTTVSPYIAKYGANGALDEKNADFPTFDGSEFTFTKPAGTVTAWSYLQGAGDPVVRYWVEKGGDSFSLFWYVAGVGAGGSDIPTACATTAYNFDCLSLALTITSGTVQISNLSHITFYDTEGTPPVIPEPASLMLLGAGLAVIAVRLRRRRA